MVKVYKIYFLLVLQIAVTSFPLTYPKEEKYYNCNTLITCEDYKNSQRKFLTHPSDCQKYWKCDKGMKVLLQCPKDKQFNEIDQKCVKPKKSSCIQKCSDNIKLFGCNQDVRCFKSTTSKYIPHPSSCRMFYRCKDSSAIVYECPEKFYFNVKKQKCVKENIQRCQKKCWDQTDIIKEEVQHFLQCLDSLEISDCVAENIEDYLRYNATKDAIAYILSVILQFKAGNLDEYNSKEMEINTELYNKILNSQLSTIPIDVALDDKQNIDEATAHLCILNSVDDSKTPFTINFDNSIDQSIKTTATAPPHTEKSQLTYINDDIKGVFSNDVVTALKGNSVGNKEITEETISDKALNEDLKIPAIIIPVFITTDTISTTPVPSTSYDFGGEISTTQAPEMVALVASHTEKFQSMHTVKLFENNLEPTKVENSTGIEEANEETTADETLNEDSTTPVFIVSEVVFTAPIPLTSPDFNKEAHVEKFLTVNTGKVFDNNLEVTVEENSASIANGNEEKITDGKLNKDSTTPTNSTPVFRVSTTPKPLTSSDYDEETHAEKFQLVHTWKVFKNNLETTEKGNSTNVGEKIENITKGDTLKVNSTIPAVKFSEAVFTTPMSLSPFDFDGETHYGKLQLGNTGKVLENNLKAMKEENSGDIKGTNVKTMATYTLNEDSTIPAFKASEKVFTTPKSLTSSDFDEETHAEKYHLVNTGKLYENNSEATGEETDETLNKDFKIPFNTIPVIKVPGAAFAPSKSLTSSDFDRGIGIEKLQLANTGKLSENDLEAMKEENSTKVQKANKETTAEEALNEDFRIPTNTIPVFKVSEVVFTTPIPVPSSHLNGETNTEKLQLVNTGKLLENDLKATEEGYSVSIEEANEETTTDEALIEDSTIHSNTIPAIKVSEVAFITPISLTSYHLNRDTHTEKLPLVNIEKLLENNLQATEEDISVSIGKANEETTTDETLNEDSTTRANIIPLSKVSDVVFTTPISLTSSDFNRDTHTEELHLTTTGKLFKKLETTKEESTAGTEGDNENKMAVEDLNEDAIISTNTIRVSKVSGVVFTTPISFASSDFDGDTHTENLQLVNTGKLFENDLEETKETNLAGIKGPNEGTRADETLKEEAIIPTNTIPSSKAFETVSTTPVSLTSSYFNDEIHTEEFLQLVNPGKTFEDNLEGKVKAKLVGIEETAEENDLEPIVEGSSESTVEVAQETTVDLTLKEDSAPPTHIITSFNDSEAVFTTPVSLISSDFDEEVHAEKFQMVTENDLEAPYEGYAKDVLEEITGKTTLHQATLDTILKTPTPTALLNVEVDGINATILASPIHDDKIITSTSSYSVTPFGEEGIPLQQFPADISIEQKNDTGNWNESSLTLSKEKIVSEVENSSYVIVDTADMATPNELAISFEDKTSTATIKENSMSSNVIDVSSTKATSASNDEINAQEVSTNRNFEVTNNKGISSLPEVVDDISKRATINSEELIKLTFREDAIDVTSMITGETTLKTVSYYKETASFNGDIEESSTTTLNINGQLWTTGNEVLTFPFTHDTSTSTTTVSPKIDQVLIEKQ